MPTRETFLGRVDAAGSGARPHRSSRVTEAVGWVGILAIFLPLAWWLPRLF